MIPIDDPANLGPTLGHYRVMLGLSLRKVARGVANRTGRHEDHVRAQICAWETGRTVPGMVAVKPYLAELRLGVALVPLDDDGPKAAPESTEGAEQASGVDGSRGGDSNGSTGRTEALALLRYALHLRQHGERAPGGNETWHEFDQRAEALLRGIDDADFCRAVGCHPHRHDTEETR